MRGIERFRTLVAEAVLFWAVDNDEQTNPLSRQHDKQCEAVRGNLMQRDFELGDMLKMGNWRKRSRISSSRRISRLGWPLQDLH